MTWRNLSEELGDASNATRGDFTLERCLADVKVLVVEDDVDTAASTVEGLRESGFDVEVAYDGEGALKLGRSFQPDVCFVDLGLPGIEGCEVGRRLRAMVHGPNATQVVAVTGYGTKADLQRTAAAGFDAHLVKPVTLDQLIDTIWRLRSPPACSAIRTRDAVARLRAATH